MANKGQPIRSVSYPGLSIAQTNIKREQSKVRLAEWRKQNPEKYRAQLKAYRIRNREKIKERNRQWYLAHKEQFYKSKRKSHLKIEHGMTPEQYEALWEKQGKKCAICKRTESEAGARFHVDHDHSSGVRRGILCPKCNHALGLFGDSVEVMKNAISYLEVSY